MLTKPVFVSLLNWNGWEDTEECICSLLDGDNTDLCITVLDNGSNDDPQRMAEFCARVVYKYKYTANLVPSVDKLKSCIANCKNQPGKSLIVYKGEFNLGFACGNNFLLGIALHSGFERFLLLNNDTVVDTSAVAALIREHEKAKYDVICPNIYYYSMPDTVWNSGGRLTFWGSRKYYNANRCIPKSRNDVKRVTYITGCALFLTRRTLETVGFFSEDFFFGEEDFEYSLRLRDEGIKVACCYNSIVYHKVGSAIGKQGLAQRQVLFYVSRLIDLKKHDNPLVFWLFHVNAYIIKMVAMFLFKEHYRFLKVKNMVKFIIAYMGRNCKITKCDFDMIMEKIF